MLSTEELSDLAKEIGVPLPYVLNTYRLESSSGRDPRDSRKGAIGPFQLLQETFDALIPGGNIRDERQNARAGIMYLKEAMDRYGDDPAKVRSYYHGGPDVRRWGPETEATANKFTQLMTGKTMPTENRGPEIDLTALARDVGGSVSNAMAALTSSMTTSQGYTDRINRALDDQKTAALLKGQGEQDLYAAIYAASARRAAGVANTLSNLGLDDESLANYQARAAQEIRMKTEQLMPMKEAITQKQQQLPQFYEDPLKWFMGNLDLRKDIQAHNALQTQVNQERANLDHIIATGKSLQDVNAGKVAFGAMQEATARSKIEQGKTNETVAKIDEENAKTNLAAAEKKLADLRQFAEMHLGYYNVLRHSADAAEQAQAKNMKRLADEATLAEKNTGLILLGRPPAASMENYMRLPPKLRLSNEMLLANGFNRIGNNAYNAYEIISTAGNPEVMAPAMRDMYKYIAAEAEITDALVNKGLPDPSDPTKMKKIQHLKPEEQNSIKSGMIVQSFIDMQKDTSKTSVQDKTNPYQAPPFEAIAARPEFAKTRLAQTLLQMKANNPNQPMEPLDVIGHVKAMISQGVYTSPPTTGILFSSRWTGTLEAAVSDLETYFREIARYNNEHFQFQKWNLPPQVQYGINGLDWSDRATILRELSRYVLREGLGIFRPPQNPVKGQ